MFVELKASSLNETNRVINMNEVEEIIDRRGYATIIFRSGRVEETYIGYTSLVMKLTEMNKYDSR